MRGPAPLAPERVRLVHSSDLHLEELGDRRCRGLSHVVDAAIELAADALLIAGDFFDSNRVRDEVVEFAAAELHRFGRPAVVVAGNHDCLVEGSPFLRLPIWQAAENVHVVRAPEGETVLFSELGVAAWGRSLATYGDGGPPLAGMPAPDRRARWNVAVAHGYFQEEDHRAWASFPMTAAEVVASGRDYVALGDSHAFGCMVAEPTKAYYSGAPSSGTHTIAVIDLDDEASTVTVTSHSLRDRY